MLRKLAENRFLAIPCLALLLATAVSGIAPLWSIATSSHAEPSWIGPDGRARSAAQVQNLFSWRHALTGKTLAETTALCGEPNEQRYFAWYALPVGGEWDCFGEELGQLAAHLGDDGAVVSVEVDGLPASVRPLPFTQNRWRSAGPGARRRMALDLEASGRLLGRSSAELEELLGAAARVANVFEYRSPDSSVFVSFDEAGRVHDVSKRSP